MKIYTKRGDTGETSLFGGKRLPKYHLRIESYGTVDELNAFIGMVRDNTVDNHVKQILDTIQTGLFNIGANLASDPEKKQPEKNQKSSGEKEKSEVEINDTDIMELEAEIDAMDKVLPELKFFILPGGHPLVSYCHIARCICRRAERRVVELAETEYVPAVIIRYLNRLSDYLFVLARKSAMDNGIQEIRWKSRS